jgi:hypothetical protein
MLLHLYLLHRLILLVIRLHKYHNYYLHLHHHLQLK